MRITNQLSLIMGAAFNSCGLPETLGQVQRSNRPDLADYQCNGAMAAAKKYKAGNPMATAERVVAAIKDLQLSALVNLGLPVSKLIQLDAEQNNDKTDTFDCSTFFSSIDVVKPGFINIKVTQDKLAEMVSQQAEDNWQISDPTLADTKVIIDSGGPNVAKSMHVGHLRTAIIGEALRRIMLAKGYQVLTDIHLGDWGTQMGMLIEGVRKRQPDLVYFDATYEGDYPDESPVTTSDLGVIYPTESALCKTDEDAAKKARLATAELQNGRRGYVALWRHFVDVSIATLRRDYDKLNVHFDLWNGESDAAKYIAQVIELIDNKGLSKVSDGALIVPITEHNADGEVVDKMPPLMLRKSDGAVMYGTTDIATLYERVCLSDVQMVLYVVDARQTQHFQQVFAVADMLGFNENASYEHNYFGTVNGKDGRPFKTRAGGVMKLSDLMQMATDEAMLKLKESNIATDMSEQEANNIADKVAIAALKFADLRNYRVKDYVFDITKFSEFEGKTGPYLLMQIARIKSILRKANEAGLNSGKFSISSDVEKLLVFKLLDFSDALDLTVEKRAPHFLCEHLYQLAQAFSSFYQQQHILNEPNAAKQASLLALVTMTLEQLEFGVNLLGIETLDRM